MNLCFNFFMRSAKRDGFACRKVVACNLGPVFYRFRPVWSAWSEREWHSQVYLLHARYCRYACKKVLLGLVHALVRSLIIGERPLLVPACTKRCLSEGPYCQNRVWPLYFIESNRSRRSVKPCTFSRTQGHGVRFVHLRLCANMSAYLKDASWPRLFQKHCDNVTVHYIDTSSHWVPLDQPEEMLAAMDNFLRRL